MTEEDLKKRVNTLKQIKVIEDVLQSMEDTDPDYIGEPVKRLRHYTLYVHQKIEQFIGRIQTVDIIMDQSKIFSENDALKIWFKLEDIFDTADFGRILKLANSKKLLPTGFMEIVFKVNNLRLIFGHPKSHYRELIDLRNELKRLEAYKILRKAMDTMNDYYSQKQKERDEIIRAEAERLMAEDQDRILKNAPKVVVKLPDEKQKTKDGDISSHDQEVK